MAEFSLGVCFDEDLASHDRATFDICITRPIESMNDLLMIEADSVALFTTSQQRLSACKENPRTAAILIPPSLSLFISETYNTYVMSNSKLKRIEDTGIQAMVLEQVHSLLGRDQCRIRGLLLPFGDSVRSRTSDILLLDIEHCSEDWLEETTKKIGNEPMAAWKHIPIIILPISNVSLLFSESAASFSQQHEIPSCSICLFRIYPPRLGLPKPRNDQLCSEYCLDVSAGAGGCLNEEILRPWPPPSKCNACNAIRLHWNNNRLGMMPSSELDDVFCNCCALQETLWICLTCGFVGCGRYSQGHAANHYTESNHPLSLEMATLRIWDYASGAFAHRGDLLECLSVRKHFPQWTSGMTMPWEDEVDICKQKKKGAASAAITQLHDAAIPKKANMLGEEYEALLQSALEDQAQHYEGEIIRLSTTLAAQQLDGNLMSDSETRDIDSLQQEIATLNAEMDIVSRKLLEAQAEEAGHRAASQRLLREQSVAKDLLTEIRQEAEKEHELGKLEVEDLEQQVADLTANLRMRNEISQNAELNEGQIYGTVTPTKLNGKRGGKKNRRGNRK